MAKIYRRLTYLICSVLITGVMYPQHLNIKNYTQNNGLPDQVVYDGTQDADGILWFTCNQGIMSYDGIEWSLLPEPGKTTIPRVSYLKIITDSAGVVWAIPFNSQTPIVYYKNKKWHSLDNIRHPGGKNFLFTDIDVIYDSTGYKLGLGTQHGFAVYNGKKATWYTEDNGLQSEYIYSVNTYSNNFILGTPKGATVIGKNGINPFIFNDEKLPGEIYLIKKLAITGDKYDFFMLNQNTLGRLDNKSFEVLDNGFTVPNVYTSNYFFLTDDHYGRLYFGNQSELYWYDYKGEKVRILDKSSGLPTSGASSVFLDREENVWITTLRGIAKITKSPFVNYRISEGLLEDEVSSIAEFDDGAIVTGHNYGFTLLDNQNISTIEIPYMEKDAYNRRVLDMDKGPDGKVWFAASHSGIGYIKRDGEIRTIKDEKTYQYTSLLFLEDGRLLAGTHDNVLLYDNGKFTPYNTDLPRFIYTRNLFSTGTGKVALTSSYNGIYIFDENEYTEIKSDSVHLANNTYSFYAKDSLWLVGTQDGLYYVSGNKLELYSRNGMTIRYPVYFINAAPGNDLWFGTNHGVLKWDLESPAIREYTPVEGLSGYETNRNAFLTDKSGKFWIGTANGLSTYISEYDNTKEVPPLVHILHIEDASGTEYPLHSEVSLENYKNNLKIFFRAISFIDEKIITYKVKLNDINGGYADEYETNENFARLVNLSPGSYRVSIKAGNARGTWSDWVDSPVFTIQQPFFKQTWFVLFSIGTLLIIAYVIQRQYTQKRYSHKLEQDIEQRTRELRKSEEQYRKLIDTAIDAIVSLDIGMRIQTWNQGCELIFGWKQDEVLDKRYYDFLGLQISREERVQLFTALYTKGYWKGEGVMNDRYGKKLNLMTSISLLRDAEGFERGFVIVMRDITEKLALQKERSTAVFETIERERSRISRDLHDDLGQILSSAKLKLEVFEYKTGISNDSFVSALEMIDSAGKELRTIIHDLHPVEIEKYGLRSAIELLCESFNKISDINFTLSLTGKYKSLHKKSELMIYRIIQEALANSLKHSFASEVEVSMNYNSSVYITVTDNGRGFALNKSGNSDNRKSGYGLLNIQQRAELLGGEISIISAPGKGTTIKLLINNGPENGKNTNTSR